MINFNDTPNEIWYNPESETLALFYIVKMSVGWQAETVKFWTLYPNGEFLFKNPGELGYFYIGAL